MDLRVKDLRAVAERLFDHLEEMGIEIVPVDDDFYWSVPPDARYDPHAEPKDLEVGQLSDDLAELEQIRRGEKEPMAYGLVWLGSLLQRVGEHVVR